MLLTLMLWVLTTSHITTRLYKSTLVQNSTTSWSVFLVPITTTMSFIIRTLIKKNHIDEEIFHGMFNLCNIFVIVFKVMVVFYYDFINFLDNYAIQRKVLGNGVLIDNYYYVVRTGNKKVFIVDFIYSFWFKVVFFISEHVF